MVTLPNLLYSFFGLLPYYWPCPACHGLLPSLSSLLSSLLYSLFYYLHMSPISLISLYIYVLLSHLELCLVYGMLSLLYTMYVSVYVSLYLISIIIYTFILLPMSSLSIPCLYT